MSKSTASRATSSPFAPKPSKRREADAFDALRRTSCRYCAKALDAPFLDLGDMPLANAFTEQQTGGDEFRCPLSVTYCDRCHLVQLLHIVPREQMFSRYLYVSSTSATFRRHFSDYAAAICDWFPKGAVGPVVDVGSNDGLLVKSFLDRGVVAMGVEPAANLSDEANRSGIPTVNRYFDESCARALVSQYGPAGVVTANNVFAHVEDVDSFCRAVDVLLHQDGLFVLEVPYLVTMCRQMLFDMIYHEHLAYLSVSAINFVLAKHGFSIVDIQEVPSHGGSLRVFAQKRAGTRNGDGSWAQYMEQEREAGYHALAGYAEFAQRVHEVRARLRKVVAEESRQGRTIAGYGAPAKANTLINFCGWTGNDIRYLVDDNVIKQGLYAPGSQIPVVGAEQLTAQPPDTILVFAWNFAEEIIGRMRAQVPASVRWIVPLPEPRYV